LLPAALLSLVFCLHAAAQDTYTITPDRGPVAGGTVVTIRGEFGEWPYGVIFGSVGVPATRVNATTLVATTPAHLPGTVPVTIFEYDIGIPSGLTFTFEGETEAAFRRLLLPVFTEPIRGAFGSEFRTELRARLANGSRAEIHGLARQCPTLCVERPDAPFVLTFDSPSLESPNLAPAGKPGQFIFIPRNEEGRVSMNLRGYDTSRSAENFGTEIPIVPEDEFFRGGDPVVLVGVPSDARFRNTLRIYSIGDLNSPVLVEIDGPGISIDHVVQLTAGETFLHPGYAQFSNFPISAGTLRVRITPIIPRPIEGGGSYWAFISVTNNETQHITTITPQP
jgi:hypothetical protein